MASNGVIYLIYLMIVIVVFITSVSAENNASEGHSPGGRQPSNSPTSQHKPGAFASLAKMIIDVPMGVVEAFKDGAEAIESLIVTMMRGLF